MKETCKIRFGIYVDGIQSPRPWSGGPSIETQKGGCVQMMSPKSKAELGINGYDSRDEHVGMVRQLRWKKIFRILVPQMILDVATGHVICNFLGQDGEVNVVKFNEYASVVVFAGYDHSLRAWECRSHSIEPVHL
ncbi:hypothetical protein SLEP1_g37233 [Rubroshorea leprosula]|uniref:Uncharacterized protein n=1 Tax=Rubroshorea leprosula TaxID=152421 RepID=A0AAV5KU16_9ROSI|nr:hypothetical protein SLEP1_g37233 [Rubroshorea leprosula]